jgi:sodium-dependent phosphate cotransporter
MLIDKLQPLPKELPARCPTLARRLLAVARGVVALYCFVVALDLLKQGAAGIGALLQAVSAHGFTNLVGFGWLGAYLSLSGSPVAALSLGLLGGGAITPIETLGMINGSRLGASFIVLITGFLYYMRGGSRGRGVISMGILSMLTTVTTYLPAMVVAIYLLQTGILDPVRFGSTAWTRSFLDVVVNPVIGLIPKEIPPLVLFGAGYAGMLLSFRLFDRALPHVETEQLQRGRFGVWIHRPWTMFVVGMLVTSLTLSVSVSLSVLVPLAARGFVGRTTVIPYIMGANITTFVDTLFAALLLASPLAFTVVLAEMIAVTTVSLFILFVAFEPYQRGLLALNSVIATNRARFAVFVAVLAAVPVVLMLV